VGYDAVRAKAEWARPPVDDVGYISSAHMLQWSDDHLRATIAQMERTRYDVNGWRNWHNGWREFFGLDTTHGKRILDFGCGVGLEALQFARAGNDVMVTDIVPDNVALAIRVLELHGYANCKASVMMDGTPTWSDMEIFYSSGTLHHTPQIRDILREALGWCEEARILVYSDRRWTALGIPLPPIDMDISTHTAFQRFVRACDEVGDFADWYSPAKLALRVEGFGRVERCQYIGKGEEFLGAVILPA